MHAATVGNMDASLHIDVPAQRIHSGRVAAILPLDPGRAARIVRGHITWLSQLDNKSRESCIDEVLDTIAAGGSVKPVLARWVPVN